MKFAYYDIWSRENPADLWHVEYRDIATAVEVRILMKRLREDVLKPMTVRVVRYQCEKLQEERLKPKTRKPCLKDQ